MPLKPLMSLNLSFIFTPSRPSLPLPTDFHPNSKHLIPKQIPTFPTLSATNSALVLLFGRMRYWCPRKFDPVLGANLLPKVLHPSPSTKISFPQFQGACRGGGQFSFWHSCRTTKVNQRKWVKDCENYQESFILRQQGGVQR